MSQAWIEIIGRDGVRRRHTLREGLTTLGGRRADVELGDTGGDQLHVWDRPPKLVFVGSGEAPRINGASVEERALRPGDVIEWRGTRLEFSGLPYAQIEEIPLEPEARRTPAVPVASGWTAADEQAWRRLKAGLLVELGMADSPAARRWQDAVLRNEFEPDSCARDILAASQNLASESRLVERSARLQRDLVMSTVHSGVRGQTRRMRSAASNWLAMALSQLIVLAIFIVLFTVALFVVRLRWQWSVDGFLDRVAQTLQGS